MTTQSIKAGLAYFALIFGAGFILGVLRVTLPVLRFGEHVAELSEMPLMFVVILVAARFVIRHFAVPPTMPGAATMHPQQQRRVTPRQAIQLDDMHIGQRAPEKAFADGLKVQGHIGYVEFVAPRSPSCDRKSSAKAHSAVKHTTTRCAVPTIFALRRGAAPVLG